MSETKAPESAYSAERTKVTGANSLRSSFETGESSESEKTAGDSKPAETPSKTGSPESLHASVDLPGTAQGGGAFPGAAAPGAAGVVADFLEFLKRTKWIWLIAAGVVFGLMLLVTVSRRTAERAQKALEMRQEQAVAALTPETLFVRCGQPAEDVTKNMYPMLVRTISYQPRENEKVVFEFSRTAEEKSDWLFLSMKDGSGKRSFDTPEAKIAALPCLDTKK